MPDVIYRCRWNSQDYRISREDPDRGDFEIVSLDGCRGFRVTWHALAEDFSPVSSR